MDKGVESLGQMLGKYGQPRLDGTPKSSGWLGEIRMPDGITVMTEQSVGMPSQYQVRKPYSGEEAYFKSNPHVAGMAAEDDRITLNPYSPISTNGMESVVANESARIWLRQNNIGSVPLTNEQDTNLRNTTYSNAPDVDRSHTILARIFADDQSGGTPTPEQMSIVKGIKTSNEIFRPSITPGMHPAVINYMRETGDVPEDAYATSRRFAVQRLLNGLSPFYNDR